MFFQLVNIGWVFFRANSFTDALIVLKKMLFLKDLSFSRIYLLYFGFIAMLYLIHLLEYYFNTNEISIASKWSANVPTYIRAAVYAAVIIILVIFNASEESTFIYFQF